MPLLLALLAATGLAGKITIAGLAPKLAPLPVTRDMKVCGTNKPDPSLEIGPGGGIRNVVVYVEDGPKPSKAPREAKKPKLDQEQCAFIPHLLAVPEDTIVDVVNDDPVLHNVRASTGDEGKLFNYAMPIKGHVVPTRLRKPGFFRVSCDVHPWMRAWLAVLPTTAFAVTGEDGSYRIDGLAPGRHKVKYWHERLGEREDEVEIAEGRETQHDLSLNPR